MMKEKFLAWINYQQIRIDGPWNVRYLCRRLTGNQKNYSSSMGLFSKIFSNTRKPEGFWGRMIVSGMATAFETVYFWPEIEKSFAEVRRILSPGGIFLIVNEDDGLSGKNEK